MMLSPVQKLEQQRKASIRAPLTSADPKNRIDTVVDIVERWAHTFARILTETQKDPDRRATLVRWLDEGVIADVLRHDDALTAFCKSAGPPPENVEARIAASFAAVARAHGGVLMDADALYAFTIRHADPADQQLMAALGPPKLGGRMRVPEMQDALLKRHEVVALCVDGEATYRLIDLNWLPSHAAIYRHITAPCAGGDCRFCRIRESAKGKLLLVAAEQSERTSNRTLDANGHRIDLYAKSGYVHRACLERWNRWVSIAKKYASEEEAAEADRKAGRAEEEMAPPPEPMIEPEPEPEPEPPPRDYYDHQNTRPAEPNETPRRTASDIYATQLARKRTRKGTNDGN